MTILDITRVTIAGFAAIRARSGPLSLIIVPDLGGKICSLRDTRTNREWLWRHPRLPYRRASADSDYSTSADSGGWDECFPTVAACTLDNGLVLPDHGELWSQAPTLEVLSRDNTVAFRCRWHGRALPYSFERTILLTTGSSKLRFEYHLTNVADYPLPFIWCAHPLLAIEPGMELRLPQAARYHVWGSMPADLLTPDQHLCFPPALQYNDADINLSHLPPALGIALKLWSDPLPAGQGSAGLYAADGALTMHWDTALLPQLALWLNLGAWAGDGGPPLYNLGLEPCIGAQDSLAEALVHNAAAYLAPGATRRWWLDVELEA
ncbi:MAG: hypothetical protein HC822_14115 [Oscillochloris sp.]|nr:hypothetical protein [Oscillochloris sp.]